MKSSDIIEELRAKVIYMTIFEFDANSPNSEESSGQLMLLELSLLFGRIWGHFVENQEEKTGDKLDNLWKLFDKLLAELPGMKFFLEGLDKFYSLEKYLKKQFGPIRGESRGRSERILRSLITDLLELLEVDDEFREKFIENGQTRRRLKKVLQHGVEDLGGILPDTFWNIFVNNGEGWEYKYFKNCQLKFR